jgi:hypothetical protein
MAAFGVILTATGLCLGLGRMVWDFPALCVTALLVCYGLMAGRLGFRADAGQLVWIGLCSALGLPLANQKARPPSPPHGTRVNESESIHAV